MKPVEIDITNIIRSRVFVWLLVIASALMLWSGSSFCPPGSASVNSSVSGMSRLEVNGYGMAALLSSLALLMSGGIMALNDRTFNILRSPSRMDVGLFTFAACATSGALGFSMTGCILCVTVLLCLMIMYTTYCRVNATRRVFLVFCFLSAGSMLQYSFAAFIPVMLLGCRQMRCLTFRSVLAAIIGIVTPYWILWGFGVIAVDDLLLPQIVWPSPSVFAAFTVPQLISVFIAVLTALLAMVYNLVQMLGRNARTRAFNGILASLTFWTVLMTVFDFGHALSFMPLLCAFAAMQLTLFFVTNQNKRSYIAVLLFVVVLVVVCIWNVID